MGKRPRRRETEGEEVFIEALQVGFKELRVGRQDRNERGRGDRKPVNGEGGQDL